MSTTSRKARVSPRSKRERDRTRPRFEELESRTLLSASSLADVVASPNLLYLPGNGYSPAQIRTAYQFASLASSYSAYNSSQGAGQTIAVVDAYDDPTIYNDLAVFDARYGLPGQTASSVTTYLSKLNQYGGATPPAATDSTGGWEMEEALDVEWVHAIAPQAKILLVEANSASISDMLAAVRAGANAGAHVVSMSWGVSENLFNILGGPGSYTFSLDSYFTAPHTTYVGSSGDNGALGDGGVNWPASSPYVMGVGGTTMPASNSSGAYLTETGWNGSGGGISMFENAPSYQSKAGVAPEGNRHVPDVAYDADPNTGFAVYDSYKNPGWVEVGGTSAGAPQWAALVALANQVRQSHGLQPLGNAQANLYDLYGRPGTAQYATYTQYFHDIVVGNNGPYSNTPGYDLVTGLGTPIANRIIGYLGQAAEKTVTTSGNIVVPTSSPAVAPFSVPAAFASGQRIEQASANQNMPAQGTTAPIASPTSLSAFEAGVARSVSTQFPFHPSVIEASAPASVAERSRLESGKGPDSDEAGDNDFQADDDRAVESPLPVQNKVSALPVSVETQVIALAGPAQAFDSETAPVVDEQSEWPAALLTPDGQLADSAAAAIGFLFSAEAWAEPTRSVPQ